MVALLTRTESARPSYSTDRQRWQAITRRDRAADGCFFYSVKTTGVYCRPGCPSRLPRRDNVQFHATQLDAEAAGFRPCQRCRPKDASLAQRQAAAVERACRHIERAASALTLGDLATAAGMSAYHFHRLFKAHTGLTPRAYASGLRAKRIRRELKQRATVTAAIHSAGFASSSRFYETSTQVLGMTAKSFRSGGSGATIRFAIRQCWLGAILVAATDQGICAILLGDDPKELTRDLTNRFPRAQVIDGDAAFGQLIARVIEFIDCPSVGFRLPLDIRGTAFQQRVWQALRDIPAGATTNYAEIARRIGRPNSARAVGQAIGANPIAVAIPCHRVVRSDGSLSGYRWGVVRKSQLQQRERAAGRKPSSSLRARARKK